MFTPLAVILSLVLLITATAVLAWPLVRAKRQPGTALDRSEATHLGTSNLSRLRGQRSSALQLIQEVDRERELGNLSEEDHRVQRAGYVRRAATLIREIEGREQVLDQDIERAVDAKRARRTKSRSDSEHQRRSAG